MVFRRFEDLRVFQLAEKLADEIWDTVSDWEYFAKDTVGKQRVKSADSIGANIAVASTITVNSLLASFILNNQSP